MLQQRVSKSVSCGGKVCEIFGRWPAEQTRLRTTDGGDHAEVRDVGSRNSRRIRQKAGWQTGRGRAPIEGVDIAIGKWALV